jgi:hypothetical protein
MGDVGAVLHGDADIREAERRGVVDAVADHGDNIAAALQFLDDPRLVRRQHVGGSTRSDLSCHCDHGHGCAQC